MQPIVTEEWRRVPGVPGYEVSSRGNVRSYLNTRGRLQPSGHPIKPWQLISGHLSITCRISDKRCKRTVHSLVAEAFIGPRPADAEVRHLDGDPTNNAVQNLAYGTRSENIKDRVRHGTHNHASKTHCKYGHAFTPDNIYRTRGKTVRVCKTCHKRRTLAAKQNSLAGAL